MRQRQRQFLAEGPHAVSAALARPGVVVEVFATAGAERALRDQAEAAGARWSEVADDVVAAVADTVTPQGVVAVCRFLDVAIDEVFAPGTSLVVIGVDVRDPGNAGALLRCADGVGADGVVLGGESVDPYNPKVVRASAGSLFHLPVAVHTDLPSLAAVARAAGLQLLAADGSADTDLDHAERRGLLAQPTAWLFGNEAHGLPVAVRELTDEAVAVPLYGRAESLNLATAAAVCLYASARARRLVERAPGE